MNVLFMGTPTFAATSLLALLDAGHHVIAAITRPDAPSGRGLKRKPPAVKDVAIARDIPVLQPDELKSIPFLEQLAGLQADIIVVVAFGRILSRRFIDLTPHGAINVHASLLPKLRGASPIAWAIARGETATGVTTMRMVEQLDAGDILLQRSTPIGPDETTGRLEARLAVLGAELLVETLAGLEERRITAIPQDESAVTWAPLLKKEDGIIDWNRPAEEIERRVRAFDPWPSARTNATAPPGTRFLIWKARVAARPPVNAEPGTIVRAERPRRGQEGGLLVVCGGRTALLVTELQPEGGKRMPSQAALAGRYLDLGDRLGGK